MSASGIKSGLEITAPPAGLSGTLSRTAHIIACMNYFKRIGLDVVPIQGRRYKHTTYMCFFMGDVKERWALRAEP